MDWTSLKVICDCVREVLAAYDAVRAGILGDDADGGGIIGAGGVGTCEEVVVEVPGLGGQTTEWCTGDQRAWSMHGMAMKDMISGRALSRSECCPAYRDIVWKRALDHLRLEVGAGLDHPLVLLLEGRVAPDALIVTDLGEVEDWKSESRSGRVYERGMRWRRALRSPYLVALVSGAGWGWRWWTLGAAILGGKNRAGCTVRWGGGTG
jgi:hypothetical protein